MVDKPVVKKPMGFPPRRPQGGRGWGGRGDGGREGDRDGGRGAGGRGAWGQQGGGRGGWGQQGGRGGRGGPFGGWGNRPPFWRDQPRQTYSSRCGGGAVWVVWDGCCCCECRVLSLPLVNCRFAKCAYWCAHKSRSVLLPMHYLIRTLWTISAAAWTSAPSGRCWATSSTCPRSTSCPSRWGTRNGGLFACCDSNLAVCT